MALHRDRSITLIARWCTKNLKFRISILLCWLICLCLHAQDKINVELLLDNGDRITGDILEETTALIRLENRVFGIVTIPKDRIVERTRLSGGTARPQQQKKPETKPPEDTEEVELEEQEEERPKHWSFSGEAGAEIRESSTKQRSAHARVRINYNNEKRFRARADWLVDFARIDGDITSSKWDGFTRGEYDFPRKRLFVFLESRTRFDLLRDIRLTLEPNGGLGYKFFDRENFKLRADLGVNYVRQQRTDGTVTTDYGLTVGQNLFWRVHKKLLLEQNLNILPRFLNTQDNFVRFDTNLRFTITDHLFTTLFLLDIYDPTPSTGVPPNDFTLRWAFGFNY